MRIWAVAAGLVMLAGAAQAQEVERSYVNPWEKDIGYANAVRHGDTLYISGVVGQGASMAEQMAGVYAEIGDILKGHGLDSKAVIRETIYTRDIEAVKANIPLRKAFYGDDYPAATWVQIDRLYNADNLIEVEVEAVGGH